MARKKTTKRTLTASLISLILCITMLIGSTFAWFTDSASTGVNKITSGNLDIALYEGKQTVGADGKVTAVTYDKEVTSSTKLFNDSALWEPGHTEVAYIKLENKGSLALKYDLNINVVSEVIGKNADNGDIKLSEILKYDAVEIDADEFYADRDEAVTAAIGALKLATETISGSMEKAAPAKYLAIIVYMPTTVGNEANHKTGTIAPSISLGVDVVATQDTVESDSFDEQYDKDATYPAATINGTAYKSVSEALTNAAAGDTVVLHKSVAFNGMLTLSKDICIDLNGNKIVSNVTSADKQYAIYPRNGANVTLKDGTIETKYAIVSEANLTLQNVKLITSFSQAISPRGGTLEIDKDSIIKVTNTAKSAVAISIIGDGNRNGANPTVNVYGKIDCAGAYAIAGNGTNKYWGTTINIYDGAELNAGLAGIFQPQDGVVNIYGGSITALRSAVEIRNGDLDISGGKFTATSETFDFVSNESGLTATGTALAVSQHTSDNPINVNITGGTFNGVYALYEDDAQNTPPSKDVVITLSGGTFNGDVLSVNNKIVDNR